MAGLPFSGVTEISPRIHNGRIPAADELDGERIMTGRPDRGGLVGATHRRRQPAPRAWLWSGGDPGRILGGRTLALLALAASLSSLGCAGRAQDPGDGWISLFDGETLAGWEGSETYFRVEDGAIVGGTDAAPIPQNEFLCRSEQWDDFEMRLRFRLEEGVNSGSSSGLRGSPARTKRSGIRRTWGMAIGARYTMNRGGTSCWPRPIPRW